MAFCFSKLPDMSSDQRRAQVIAAYKSSQPGLTVELAPLYLEREPDDRHLWLIYGQALNDLARYAEARSAYERALALTPDEERAPVYRLLGQLHEARSELREAERYYRDAIALAPEHPSAYVFLGGMLALNGRLEEAERIHRRGTECVEGPTDEAFYNLGLVQRARRDYLGALTSFRRALELDPDYEEARQAIRDVEALLFEFPDA
jgi:tetratricopeptide (TPR) repeat protein